MMENEFPESEDEAIVGMFLRSSLTIRISISTWRAFGLATHRYYTPHGCETYTCHLLWAGFAPLTDNGSEHGGQWNWL